MTPFLTINANKQTQVPGLTFYLMMDAAFEKLSRTFSDLAGFLPNSLVTSVEIPSGAGILGSH